MRVTGLASSGFTLCFLAVLAATAMANPTIFPTGTTIYDPERAWNGYVLFSAPTGNTHLIDMDGNEVNQWNRPGFPAEMLDPALNDGKKGHILVQIENNEGMWGGIFDNIAIGEVDWDGETVWSWRGENEEGADQSHDWARLPNGNTLAVVAVPQIVPALSKTKTITDEHIVEVSPSGEVVWRWSAGLHLDQFGLSEEGLNLWRTQVEETGGLRAGFITINDMAPIGQNKWFDAGDTRFHPDNIVIDSREASFIAIIEKKSGDIVWRIGPDYPAQTSAELRPRFDTYVPRPVDQTSGQHDAHIIPKGLPGAGNLLVFDNVAPSGYPATRLPLFYGSRILEIDPIEKQIVWQYTAVESGAASWTFASSFISSARRLPNGNTLINEGMNGRMFQVTPTGDIVWEYVNPHFGSQTYTSLNTENRTVSTNWVFRAQPIPYDWVPEDTPRSEKGVAPIDIKNYRVQ